MPRTEIPVVTAGSGGTTVSPMTLDSGNGMEVSGFDQAMEVVCTNTDGVNPITMTFVQRACPTCGIATNRVVTVPASGRKVVSGLLNILFRQDDGTLHVNPSADTGNVYALARP